jgi:hypothetical protein
MNPYFSKLNFPDNVNYDVFQYKKDRRNHIRSDKNAFGKEIEDLLSDLKIKIHWIEAFYLGNFADHSIHCDGHELDNKAKLNYIIGGKDSEMVWYEPLSDDKIQKKTSWANTIYLGIAPEDVRVVHSAHLSGFNLVNVGLFHNVYNKTDDRYCLSACLLDQDSGERLTYNELQSRLKEYIV